MTIYSFVGIPGPLKTWLIIIKKEDELKIQMKLSKF